MTAGRLNYDGLSAAISEQQIDEVIRADGNWLTGRRWFSIVATASIFFGWLVGPFGATTSLTRLGVFVIAAGLVTAALIGLGRVVRKVYRQAVVHQLRLEQFARDNNLQYVKSIANPTYPGVIFSTGNQRRIKDQFIGETNGLFEVGNYEYTVRHGKSSTTYYSGYIRIALDRHIAHMLLDSTANNTNIFGARFSNLPIAMARDQTLRLEGDFNEHFTLYAPKEYARDALYIFTPDLMALLIDQAGKFDVEVIDDQLFVYGNAFDFYDQATWERIARIISTVGAKTISQTDYYADEQIGDRTIDVVASGGRRLRRGIPWMTVAAVGFGFLFVFGQVVIDWVIRR